MVRGSKWQYPSSRSAPVHPVTVKIPRSSFQKKQSRHAGLFIFYFSHGKVGLAQAIVAGGVFLETAIPRAAVEPTKLEAAAEPAHLALERVKLPVDKLRHGVHTGVVFRERAPEADLGKVDLFGRGERGALAHRPRLVD